MPEPIQVLLDADRRAAELQAMEIKSLAFPTLFRGAPSHSGAFLLQALEEQGWTLAPKTDDERWTMVERSFRGLVGVARAMLDERYPPDVFVGGGPATDSGVAFVVKLREALACVHADPETHLEGGGR